MARAESKMVMGYLPIEERHYPALLSLVAPASPTVRLLDPFAGEGAFLEAAAQAWNITPYANELDGERAAKCIERFGPTQAVRCDVERLVASNNAFGGAWLNPPYDHDAAASGSKRVEFRYLRHAWKWIQDGGLALWCVYRQHITQEAAAFLAKHSSRVDVWALPGKHLDAYDQMVVAAIKGVPLDTSALYEQIVRDRDNPQPLTVQPEPCYRLPAPRAIQRFVFAPDMLDEAAGLKLIEEQGAWKTAGFQALLDVPPPPAEIEPVVAPRPGHLALVLAAGVADGAVIETDEYGRVAPHHPTTQGKIERFHLSSKNKLLLNIYATPERMEQAIGEWVQHYNYVRYHEALDNVTPADMYDGRQPQILTQRQQLKLATIAQRKALVTAPVAE